MSFHSVVTISFLEVPYEVSENVENFTVQIGIDRDIVRTLTFDVSGGRYSKAKNYIMLIFMIIIEVLCFHGEWNLLFPTGPGSQPPSVVISATNVDEMYLYFDESITVIHVIVNVTDDQVPLEAVEEYSLVISNTNPSEDVTVGNVGTIRIIDDDGKCMCVLFYINMQVLLNVCTVQAFRHMSYVCSEIIQGLHSCKIYFVNN